MDVSVIVTISAGLVTLIFTILTIILRVVMLQIRQISVENKETRTELLKAVENVRTELLKAVEDARAEGREARAEGEEARDKISEAIENVRIEMKGDHRVLKTSVDDLGKQSFDLNSEVKTIWGYLFGIGQRVRDEVEKERKSSTSEQ